MWMRKGDQLIPLALNLPDLPARLRADGWVEVSDPRASSPDAREPATEAQPPSEPAESERSPLPPLDIPVISIHDAPVRRARR